MLPGGNMYACHLHLVSSVPVCGIAKNESERKSIAPPCAGGGSMKIWHRYGRVTGWHSDGRLARKTENGGSAGAAAAALRRSCRHQAAGGENIWQKPQEGGFPCG